MNLPRRTPPKEIEDSFVAFKCTVHSITVPGPTPATFKTVRFNAFCGLRQIEFANFEATQLLVVEWLLTAKRRLERKHLRPRLVQWQHVNAKKRLYLPRSLSLFSEILNLQQYWACRIEGGRSELRAREDRSSILGASRSRSHRGFPPPIPC
jgi:hypothetical protein